MAKCPVCNDRKGKRLCRARLVSVCPPCCATIRVPDACGDCGFYMPPTRDYDHLPRFSPHEMNQSLELQHISFPIEAAVCLADRERGYKLNDEQAIAMFEVLLDLYAFGDTLETLADRIRQLGCEKVVEIVEREVAGQPREDVAKILGTARFTACRRNSGGRQHLDVLQQYAGAFVRSGVGIRRFKDGTEVPAEAFPTLPAR
ncbi:MAG: hypothetical protein HY905_03860 [Deltaproteobacteria bacterium]|nr:hypothetical protein [Deltaproteobacteria bacterium]